MAKEETGQTLTAKKEVTKATSQHKPVDSKAVASSPEDAVERS
jgi:hypothetical protein